MPSLPSDEFDGVAEMLYAVGLLDEAPDNAMARAKTHTGRLAGASDRLAKAIDSKDKEAANEAVREVLNHATAILDVIGDQEEAGVLIKAVARLYKGR